MHMALSDFGRAASLEDAALGYSGSFVVFCGDFLMVFGFEVCFLRPEGAVVV